MREAKVHGPAPGSAVSGTKARLYLNDAVQPCLIVNDLKQGRTAGSVALWAGPDSDCYFKNLTVTPTS